MPLNIPTTGLANWAAELVTACQTSLETRRQKGAAFRNIYLTGSEEGTPQTYKKTYAYIKTRAAMLYSPVELRFLVSPYGPAGPRERAMGRAAATTLHEYIRGGRVDTTVEDAVEWGLVKGKTFIQLEWSRSGIQAYMVQPETMGVLRDDITSLDKQDAFVHSTWMTEARFASHIAAHPRRAELMRKIPSLSSPDADKPETADNSRQVMIGGQLYPYRSQGTQGAGQGRGLVNWLSGAAPEMDAKTLASLIRLDELWVWDRNRDDWTTLQLVGTELIEPTVQHRNLFADGAAYEKGGKRVGRGEAANELNPLSGHHPFIEICPNPLPDYFWGWSELMNVASIQMAINNRVDGINRLLRRQEDPPYLISGSNTPINQLRSRLRKPGGWHAENNPNIKVEKMAPDLPAGLWESLHELESMFEMMGGSPPVMQGQGEQGVRSQAHAETLVRMAGARLKDDALGVERQVEEVGGLCLDLMRAHLAENLHYWVKESHAGPFKGKTLDPLLYEPPAPGEVAIPFNCYHLDDRFKVSVDSHSSSPAFSHEAEQRADKLVARGAIGPEEYIRQVHPANEEELVEAFEAREAARAAFIQAHPELLQKGHGKSSAKH